MRSMGKKGEKSIYISTLKMESDDQRNMFIYVI